MLIILSWSITFEISPKPPRVQGLSPGFHWYFISGVWSLTPIKHANKFKELNPCLEDLKEDQLDDLEGEHQEATSGGMSTEGAHLEEIPKDDSRMEEQEAQEHEDTQEITESVSNDFESEFQKNIRRLMPNFCSEALRTS